MQRVESAVKDYQLFRYNKLLEHPVYDLTCSVETVLHSRQKSAAE